MISYKVKQNNIYQRIMISYKDKINFHQRIMISYKDKNNIHQRIMISYKDKQKQYLSKDNDILQGEITIFNKG